MESNYCNEQETDDSNDEHSNSDSSYIVVSQIRRPTIGTLSKTVERLKNGLVPLQKANERLQTKISKLKTEVMKNERQHKKEMASLELTTKTELMEKESNIHQTMHEIETMRQRNTELHMKIKKYENTINGLETNEKALRKELAAFEDTKTIELENESRKTADIEKELQDLKQRLEENDKQIFKELKDHTVALNTLTKASEESKKNEANVNQKLNDMQQSMNQMVSLMQTRKAEESGTGQPNTIATRLKARPPFRGNKPKRPENKQQPWTNNTK